MKPILYAKLNDGRELWIEPQEDGTFKDYVAPGRFGEKDYTQNGESDALYNTLEECIEDCLSWLQFRASAVEFMGLTLSDGVSDEIVYKENNDN